MTDRGRLGAAQNRNLQGSIAHATKNAGSIQLGIGVSPVRRRRETVGLDLRFAEVRAFHCPKLCHARLCAAILSVGRKSEVCNSQQNLPRLHPVRRRFQSVVHERRRCRLDRESIARGCAELSSAPAAGSRTNGFVDSNGFIVSDGFVVNDCFVVTLLLYRRQKRRSCGRRKRQLGHC